MARVAATQAGPSPQIPTMSPVQITLPDGTAGARRLAQQRPERREVAKGAAIGDHRPSQGAKVRDLHGPSLETQPPRTP